MTETGQGPLWDWVAKKSNVDWQRDEAKAELKRRDVVVVDNLEDIPF